MQTKQNVLAFLKYTDQNIMVYLLRQYQLRRLTKKMIEAPAIALQSSHKIEQVLNKYLKSFNIQLYSYTKSYPDNTRFTLASDVEFLNIYFKTKRYEIDWLGYPLAIEFLDDNILPWQCCHVEHLSCVLWKQHKAIRDIDIYFSLYIRHDGYNECHIFGAKADLINQKQDSDKELFFFMNNRDLLKRFIQDFKSDMHDVIEQAEKSKYRVDTINTQKQKEEFDDYWGGHLKRREAFLRNTKPEKIYLDGQFYNVFLTLEEASMLKAFYYGATYKKIADEFGVSTRTIESRFSKIKEKLKADSKLQLMETIAKHKIMTVIELCI